MVIGTMSASGGAERVFAHMLHDWSKKYHDLYLFTFDSEQAESFYVIPDNVTWVKLGGVTNWWGYLPTTFAKAVFFLKEQFKKNRPDLVLSFMNVTNVATLMAINGIGVPCIISDRNNPDHDGLNPVLGYLRKIFYNKADQLVVLTNRQIDCYSESLKKKTTAIMNPLFPPEPAREVKLPCRRPFILSVGRLRVQKGHDVLIKAFARIASDIEPYSLVILGEGVERPALQSLIDQYQLRERVLLAGIRKDVYDLMHQCDIFVFPSRWEGLGNAYLEAMARGVAVLACDCPFGPGEMIEHGKNGLLTPVDDVESLAYNLKQLCISPDLRLRLSQQAKNVLKTLDPVVIMRQWDALINRVLTGKDLE